jgi:hypothetical protein
MDSKQKLKLNLILLISTNCSLDFNSVVRNAENRVPHVGIGQGKRILIVKPCISFMEMKATTLINNEYMP